MCDSNDRLVARLASDDGSTRVSASVSPADDMPDTSVFDNVNHVSDFFERGSLGYSDRRDGECYDGSELRTENWMVAPVLVDSVMSSYFDDTSVFPAGSVVLDNALVMRQVHHSWHSTAPLPVRVVS